jgi:hypothetical protein
MPAAQRGTVVGRTAALPLPAGVLVSAQQLGQVAWPPAGQSVIAVGIKPGRAPAGLTAGTQVTVIVIPSAAPGAGGTSGTTAGGSANGGEPQVARADATVVSVTDAADQSGVSVVSLLLSAAGAARTRRP